MKFWKRKAPDVPGRVLGSTHGLQVTRVQFNRGGGFKLSGTYNGADTVWWVPTDPANAQVQWIREWMIGGGFPEEADRDPKPPSFLFIPHSGWKVLGTIAIVAGTLMAGVAGLMAVVPGKLC